MTEGFRMYAQKYLVKAHFALHKNSQSVIIMQDGTNRPFTPENVHSSCIPDHCTLN
jgi:hypothetical protein